MAQTEFKAESRKLLDLMINSIYTHKEIFLREIISNASDAIDKLLFISLTDSRVGMTREDFKITITLDKEKRLLTVSDNGIGMNAEDMENNLGVIAASGSEHFREAMQNADAGDASELIGRFGVGFYSAFMVSDRVTVISRKYGETQGWRWRSSGASGYEISACSKDEVGTDVIMHIRDDEFSLSAGNDEGTHGPDWDEYSRYLREYPIYKLVKKYSDYIRFPIMMLMPHPEVKPGSSKENPEYEEKFEYETLNSMRPIWERSKSEVAKEEYDEFYRNTYDEKEAPARVLHLSVEGNISYRALLFIPSKAPEKYDTDDYIPGLKLYSSGVKIMEHCMGLLPEAFDFIQGVVDSPDLSLNISRETLQQDKQLRIIASNIEKKIRSELTSMLANEREEYEKFFTQFGRRIKVCAIDNYGDKKDQLKDLLMFFSSKTGKLITLSEYVANMREGQKYIYYASGHTFDSIDRLPQTELLKDRDIEILYFTDKADELVATMFGSYNDFLFRSCIDGDLGLEGEDKPECLNSADSAEAEEEMSRVFAFVKEILAGSIDEVRASSKLKSHPVCLSSGKGISFEMEKYFRAMQPNVPVKAKRILEINTSHDAYRALAAAVESDRDRAASYAEILFCQALLIAGLPIPDPSRYTDLVCKLFA